MPIDVPIVVFYLQIKQFDLSEHLFLISFLLDTNILGPLDPVRVVRHMMIDLNGSLLILRFLFPNSARAISENILLNHLLLQVVFCMYITSDLLPQCKVSSSII
jgi:hypothetical protein